MNSAKKIALQELSCLLHKEHVLFTGRACTGLWLFLKAAVFCGSTVIVPANICSVVPATAILAGMQLYFIDIDQFGGADINQLRMLGCPKGSVFIAAHMYGNVCDMAELRFVCREKGWLLIEDIAQAMGAEYNGEHVGIHSSAVMASFGIGKHFDLPGGGLFAVEDPKIFCEMQKISSGLPVLSLEEVLDASRLFNVLLPQVIAAEWNGPIMNALMNTLVLSADPDEDYCKALTHSVRELKESTAVRRAKAQLMARELNHPLMRPQEATEGASYWRFNFLVESGRNAVLEMLRKKGIKASSYFAPCAVDFPSIDPGRYDAATEMGKKIINLWVGKQTSMMDAESFVQALNRFNVNED